MKTPGYGSKRMDKAMRRFFQRRLDRAVLSLVRAAHEPARGIHDCRKALKQTRTLLRILRPQMGDAAGRCGEVCKLTAASLSAARDAHVMQEGWQEIVAGGQVDAALVAAVAEGLSRLNGDDQMGRPDLFALAKELSQSRDELLANWAIRQPGKLYRKRMARFRRRTLQSWSAAEETGQATHYHAARKAAKNWMYGLRVVRSSWDKQTRWEHQALKDFTDALGKANDAALLEDWLGRATIVSEPERQAALKAVRVYRDAWLAKARNARPFE